MSCCALSLTLGILSSLVFPDVSGAKLPLAENNFNTITRRIFIMRNEDLPQSREMEDSTLNRAPTKSGRVSSPTIVNLQPFLAKSEHAHANLPLRFGRDSAHMQRLTKSSINLPQRFGRSGYTKSGLGLRCTLCRRTESPPSATLPQRFGKRDPLFWDPFHTGAVFTYTLDVPSIKEMTPDDDYLN